MLIPRYYHSSFGNYTLNKKSGINIDSPIFYYPLTIGMHLNVLKLIK